MNEKRFFLGLLMATLASAAVATPSAKAPACGLKIETSWIRAAPPMSMQLAGYALLRNDCATAITVASIRSEDFGMAMIHQTVVENGVSKMRHLDSLTVPAKSTVGFAPGGWHLMLMQPARELKPGDTASLTFRLANGSEIVAAFPVLRDPPATGK
jgi:copper(I)-binding protein